MAINREELDRQLEAKYKKLQEQNVSLESHQEPEVQKLDRAKELGSVALHGVTQAVAIPGLAGDAVNAMLPYTVTGKVLEQYGIKDPLVGSADIQRAAEKLFNSVGLKTQDAKAGDLVANIVQLGASSAVPAGALIKLGQLKNAPMWLKTIAENPKKFLGIEAAGSVALPASGRTLMEVSFPENAETAGLVGELLGIPGMLAYPAAVTGAKKAYRMGKNVLSDDTARDRAADVLSTVVKDKEKAIRGLDEFGDSPVAPGKQSGDEGLIAAARAKSADDPVMNMLNEEAVTTKLTSDLDKLGGEGKSSVYVDAAKDAVTSRVRAIENSVEAAALKAQDDISKLPNIKREEASRIVYANINEKYGEMRKAEDKLWSATKTDSKIAGADQLSNTIRTFENLIVDGKSAREIPEDMMALVSQYLFKSRKFTNGTMQVTLKDDVTAKTLQNLRSRILNEIDKATSGATPDRNRAALLGDLQESLLDDMANITEISDELALARAHSYALNNRFNRGPIGKVRGTSADGSLRTDPDLTLKKLIVRGEQGGVNLRALADPSYSPKGKIPGKKHYAEKTAESAVRSGESTEAISDYMSSLFLAETKKSGKFDPEQGRKFVESYGQVLDNLPQLKSKLEAAVESGSAAQIRSKGAKLDIDQVMNTKVATLLNIDNPKRVMGKIRASSNPAAELKNAVEVVKGDPVALSGLRKLVFEEARESITTSREIGTTGLKEISRAKAETVFSPEYKQALLKSGLIDKEQLNGIDYFLKQVNAHMRNVDAKVPGTSGTSQDILGKIAKISALKWVVPKLGVTGPGQLSTAGTVGTVTERFVKNLGVDMTDDLVKRALLGSNPEDKALLRDLLTRINSPQEELKIVQRLNTYLLTSGMRYNEEDTPVEKRAYKFFQ